MTFRIDIKNWARDFEQLSQVGPEVIEDEASLALMAIFGNGKNLTHAEDIETSQTRPGPILPGNWLAAWFAWNWWRLRWEPKGPESEHSLGWRQTHRLANTGGGFIWPDLTFSSDGNWIRIEAQPSRDSVSESLRYLVDRVEYVSGEGFEEGVDSFVDQILQRLRENRIAHTNLERLWSEVAEERQDPETFLYRKIEALLGHDPDEAAPQLVDRIVEGGRVLGEAAMEEVATNFRDQAPSARELIEQAEEEGSFTRPENRVPLEYRPTPTEARVPAWKHGVEAARQLRAEQGLDGQPIKTPELAEMYGVSEEVVVREPPKKTMAFELLGEDGGGQGRVVLRSDFREGRRFELARLLGDSLLQVAPERLHPSTRTYSYRQQMQRAFAGEFLCPIESLQDVLGGDTSDDAQRKAMEYFEVQPGTIWTQLVNNNLIDRDRPYAD